MRYPKLKFILLVCFTLIGLSIFITNYASARRINVPTGVEATLDVSALNNTLFELVKAGIVTKDNIDNMREQLLNLGYRAVEENVDSFVVFIALSSLAKRGNENIEVLRADNIMEVGQRVLDACKRLLQDGVKYYPLSRLLDEQVLSLAEDGLYLGADTYFRLLDLTDLSAKEGLAPGKLLNTLSVLVKRGLRDKDDLISTGKQLINLYKKAKQTGFKAEDFLSNLSALVKRGSVELTELPQLLEWAKEKYEQNVDPAAMLARDLDLE